ncbi:HupE/UreJ family protein [Muriicola sp. Z0-33]|uniref:HupE/UreJ family protein n=1 Tax=Muriicola sp. Z0-33 TaxID=2816957 RepID=UPI002236F397|nr:HupE/UreJ family protein [Muriicola sp. Z0-33]MCW5516393.1 HupE/UreJ family protein [Muriicola sp. Z0-33]
MEEFWFYITLGFNHVMDPNAYDHILFLCALAIPFTFKGWKKVVVLATIFTVTHCISLGISAYGILSIEVPLIEFLIPVTIILTAAFNIFCVKYQSFNLKFNLHILATAFFGFIHGFGFSNYFNMLMAEEDEKIVPLLGFAGGIEISQLLILLVILLATSSIPVFLKIKQANFIILSSIVITIITIPLLLASVPG